MRIERLTTKNFLGHSEVELTPGPITLLYGRNGSGKSSVADAILFALTGEAVRGSTLGDLLRQGSKAAEVFLTVDGLEIIRRRTKSAGEQAVNGVFIGAVEAERDIAAHVGRDKRTVTAALRAGALLELKPAELQKLLADLTGAEFNAEAIAEELGTEVFEAAKRIRIPLPQTLEEFPGICTSAENARKAAKRTLAEKEADLQRAPKPVANVPATLPDLQALRKRHAAAVAAQAAAKASDDATRAERRRTLEARRAELLRVKKPDTDAAGRYSAVEADLQKATKEVGRLEAELGRADAKLADLKQRETVENTGEETRETVTARIADLTTQIAGAERERSALQAEWARLSAQLKDAEKSPCDGKCTHHCPDAAGLKAQIDELTAKGKAAKVSVEKLQGQKKVAEKWLATLDLRETEAEFARLTAEFAAGTKRVADLTTQGNALWDAAEALKAFLAADAERSQVEEQIAKLHAEKPATAPAAEDPAAVEQEIAQAEAAHAAAEQLARHQKAVAAVQAAEQQVEDADTLAQATGPKGARLRLLAQAVQPFLDAANAALEQLAPGHAVDVLTDGELEIVIRRGGQTLRPLQLSDGERMRVLYVLQYAVTKLAGVGVLVLDRTELVDEGGKKGLRALMAACAADGIQVLMLTCAPAPASVPPSVTAYAFEAGRATRLGTPEHTTEATA